MPKKVPGETRDQLLDEGARMLVLEQLRREKDMLDDVFGQPMQALEVGNGLETDDENGEDSENSDTEAA